MSSTPGPSLVAHNYALVNPGLEEALFLLDYVSDDELRRDAADVRKMVISHGDDYFPRDCDTDISVPPPSTTRDCLLTALPPELLDAVLAYLSPVDLTVVSSTCRTLRRHATCEALWLHRVQANLPGVTLTSPYPCKTYRELYYAHDPRWFLPKYKVWFCDRDLVGKLIIMRYDQRRGCIEGYQLVAICHRTSYQNWSQDNHVVIHDFEPHVKLHLDKPVVQFHADEGLNRQRGSAPHGGGFKSEVPMTIQSRPDPMFCNFLLARPLPHADAVHRAAQPFPHDFLWPPPAVPARHRVAGVPGPDDLQIFDQPRKRTEASDQTFRIRQWMELGGSPAAPSAMLDPGLVGLMQGLNGRIPPRNPDPNGVGGAAAECRRTTGVRLGEEITTYSTLDPSLYTPTDLKPWRGIWVGDYSGHGCEFLLVNQPDDPEATDTELGLCRGAKETDEAWQCRRREARMYRGRLEAIKLTGDPNVPRGEYTFVADDLGGGGFVGITQDAPFKGARVVRSKGHVARHNFVRDKYIESQLILISKDRLAQYWVGFSHISFFERVNIDQFLTP